MHPQTYKMLAEREDNYWWHVARRAMSTRLLKQCTVPQGVRWLDLGCGPGGNLSLAERFAPCLTVGLDLSAIAISFAERKKPEARLVRADLNNALPFADSTFDVVTVFNVLYHDWVLSEAAVIAEIKRVLRPSGVFLITEPAFSILAREMDVAAMGHRRYRIADIVRLCDAAGLRVARASYFTSFGFLLLLAMKLLPRRIHSQASTPRQGADMRPLGPTANTVLRLLAELEGEMVSRGIRFPVGTTLLCVARKD